MNSAEILRRVNDEMGRRLARCAAECAKELKITVSVPAPRKVSKKTGRPYAKTAATPGAPPRKLSGRGRASIAWKLAPDKRSAIVGTNVGYMKGHEAGTHKFVAVTLSRCRAKLTAILNGAA